MAVLPDDGEADLKLRGNLGEGVHCLALPQSRCRGGDACTHVLRLEVAAGRAQDDNHTRSRTRSKRV